MMVADAISLAATSHKSCLYVSLAHFVSFYRYVVLISVSGSQVGENDEGTFFTFASFTSIFSSFHMLVLPSLNILSWFFLYYLARFPSCFLSATILNDFAPSFCVKFCPLSIFNYLILHMAMEWVLRLNLLADETNCVGVHISADG